MRRAKVFVDGTHAGYLEEVEKGKEYRVVYFDEYQGKPISLTMPITNRIYTFDTFPPFFDGLLPEGMQLEALLKIKKLDLDDEFGQLLAVGQDMVGYVTVEPE